MGDAALPTFSPGRTLTLLSPPTFAWHKVNLATSSSILLLFLPLEASDNKPDVYWGTCLSNIFARGNTSYCFLTQLDLTWRPKRSLHCLQVEVPWQINAYLNLKPKPPTFAWHKVNLLSSNSVLLFFLSPEVSNNKPGVDGEEEDTFPKKFLPEALMLSSQLLHDTKSIFCHHVQFFIFYKLGVESWGDRPPNIFATGNTNAFLSTFTWHKVNLLSSSSVLYFFYTTWSQR